MPRRAGLDADVVRSAGHDPRQRARQVGEAALADVAVADEMVDRAAEQMSGRMRKQTRQANFGPEAHFRASPDDSFCWPQRMPKAKAKLNLSISFVCVSSVGLLEFAVRSQGDDVCAPNSEIRKPGAPCEDGRCTQMLAEQRRTHILLELQRTGEARTRQLAAGFGVSEVTIRSDLALLESRNQLIKTHGGAVSVPTDSPTAAFEQRMQRNFDAKRRIAQTGGRPDHRQPVGRVRQRLDAAPARHADAAGRERRRGDERDEHRPVSDVSPGPGRAHDRGPGLPEHGQHDRLRFRRRGGRPPGASGLRRRPLRSTTSSTSSTSQRISRAPNATWSAWLGGSSSWRILANGTSARPPRRSRCRASISLSPTTDCQRRSGADWKNSKSRSNTCDPSVAEPGGNTISRSG